MLPRMHLYLVLSSLLFSCEELLQSMLYHQVLALSDRGLDVLERMHQQHLLSKTSGSVEIFPVWSFRLRFLLMKQQAFLLLGDVQKTQPLFEEIKSTAS